jgi:hypothetical protein
VLLPSAAASTAPLSYQKSLPRLLPVQAGFFFDRCPMLLDSDCMKDQRIPVMMSADDVAAIDEWRRKQADLPSRSEAIRRLVELG